MNRSILEVDGSLFLFLIVVQNCLLLLFSVMTSMQFGVTSYTGNRLFSIFLSNAHCFLSSCSVVQWTPKVKFPLLRTQSCKAWSRSEHSHACFVHCQKHFLVLISTIPYFPAALVLACVVCHVVSWKVMLLCL